MKKFKLPILLMSLLLSSHQTLASGLRHFHGAGGIGFSLGYRGYYGPGFGFYPGYGFGGPFYPYYSPPVINVVPQTPPIYIQRGEDAANTSLPANFWYYCQAPSGYYPDVKSCPGGWQAVAPIPADK